jgi:hypothetical protein
MSKQQKVKVLEPEVFPKHDPSIERPTQYDKSNTKLPMDALQYDIKDLLAAKVKAIAQATELSPEELDVLQKEFITFLNEKVDVPLLTEEMEEKLFNFIFDFIEQYMKGYLAVYMDKVVSKLS